MQVQLISKTCSEFGMLYAFLLFFFCVESFNMFLCARCSLFADFLGFVKNYSNFYHSPMKGLEIK